MLDERRKQYMDEYNKKKLAHFKMVRKLMSDDTPISKFAGTGKALSDKQKEERIVIMRKLQLRFTVKGNKCARCERLFKYGGAGDGIICSDCIDYEQNGPKPYFSRTPGLY